ncbi:MAG: branched-chain amino acid ABC transporter permease [Chloroflexi bacterium]|nr:branched-chain amino acid ABC transporter permease [Chloroflexota bacterium]
MVKFAQAIVDGIATGSVYAIIALALVLIYRTTKVLNFAQGEMAVLTTYVDWTLLNHGLPFWAALLATLPVAAAIGLLIERIFIRPVEDKPQLNGLIVTLGLLAMISSAIGMIWGVDVQPFPQPLSGAGLRLAGTSLSRQELGTIGITVAIMALMYFVVQRTRVGLAMRAASLDPTVSRLLGVRVGSALATGWSLATLVGAVAGSLVAPAVLLRPAMMDDVFIFGFAGAVLGGMESLAGGVVGGLLVGVIYTLAGTYAGPELQLFTALIVIVVVLMIRPEGLFGSAQVRRV